MSTDEREKKSPSPIDPLALINRLAEDESRVLSSTFVAPVVPGGRVSVSISGVPYELRVNDPKQQGWFVLKCNREGIATICGDASLAQIKQYLSFLPQFRLILLDQFDGKNWALQANTSDTRVSIAGPVSVRLVENVSRFETICARFDGGNFWFESSDRSRNPKVANSLREALQADVEPDSLRILGAIPQEKLAYRMLWLRKHPELHGRTSQARSDAERIERALEHAGALLNSYESIEQNLVRVQYTVDGQRHVSTVRTDDLSVVSSGICLSGLDHMFDLTTLVGVMRQSGYDDY